MLAIATAFWRVDSLVLSPDHFRVRGNLVRQRTSGDVEAEDKTDATAPAPSVKENLKLLLDALTAPSLT
jgi:hypothetical protein